MASPSVTYTFTNGTVADAGQMNTNFTDIINAMTDGSKSFSIDALTCAGTVTLNGAVNLGNATGDDITITGYVASAILPKTDATYALGGASNAWSALYVEGLSNLDGAVVINESSADVDFRVEGNGDANLLFCDGGNDVIGVGTASPVAGNKMTISRADTTTSFDATDNTLRIENLSNTANCYTGITFGTYQQNGAIWVVNAPAAADRKLNLSPMAGTVPISMDGSNNVGIGVSTLTSYRCAIGSGTDALGTLTVYNTLSDATTQTLSQFSMEGDADPTGAIFIGFRRSGASIGSISASTASATAYNTTSDKRLKNDIGDFSGLEIVKNLVPRKFSWKSSGQINHGLYAQDAYEYYPEAILVGGDDPNEKPWSLDYAKLTPILLKAIQEQQVMIEELKSKVG